MTVLCDLCVKYGTDKVIWGYTPTYFEHLAPKREEVRKVLEVGICGERDIPNNVTGASLFVWRDFFPNAEIIGLDNDPRWMVNTDRIRSFCVDAYDSAALGRVLNEVGGDFDLIVDDAVHDPIPQLGLLADLWPSLRDGGLYAMEDVCPYKLPNGQLRNLTRHFPAGGKVDVHVTHKAERLILIRK